MTFIKELDPDMVIQIIAIGGHRIERSEDGIIWEDLPMIHVVDTHLYRYRINNTDRLPIKMAN